MAAMLVAILGKKSCTYYSFVSKVMCTKYGAFGAERPTANFAQGRPLATVAILVAIVETKLMKNCTSMKRYCVPNLVKKDLMV